MPHPDTEAGSCTRTHSKVPSRRADGSATAARNRRHQWQALTENSLHSPAASVFQGVIPARYGPLPFSASMPDTGTLLFSPRCPAVPDTLLRKKAFLLLFRFPHGSRTAMLFPASPTPCLRRLFRTARWPPRYPDTRYGSRVYGLPDRDSRARWQLSDGRAPYFFCWSHAFRCLSLPVQSEAPVFPDAP